MLFGFLPERCSTSLRNAVRLRRNPHIEGRFHDTRHTLITELAESGAGDQTIMDIAGHVSRQMLGRYSHIRMEAKRKALEAVTTKAKPASTAHSAGTTETAGETKKNKAGEF
jgi:integrase